SGLTAGLTYFYQVTAVNTPGESPRSNERSATPTSAATVPGAPTLNTATAVSSSITLGWSAPSSNGGSQITGYRVYRSTASGADTLLTTLGIVTSFTDNGLTNGVTYFYKVSAVNAIGEGRHTTRLSATHCTIP